MAGFRSRKRTGGKITKTAAKSYRRHRRASHCHKKSLSRCTAAPGCGIVKKSKRAKGYCRKYKNTRRRGGRGRRGGSSCSRHPDTVTGGGRRRHRTRGRRGGGLSPLSPFSLDSSSSASPDVSGHWGSIVPGGPGNQGSPPTAAHELSSPGMHALQVGEGASGATALTDPLRPKPYGGEVLPYAFV